MTENKTKSQRIQDTLTKGMISMIREKALKGQKDEFGIPFTSHYKAITGKNVEQIEAKNMKDGGSVNSQAGMGIRRSLDAIRYKRSDEGKAEKKARKEHNKKFGPTDKKTKEKLRKDAKKSDAAKGKYMRATDNHSYYEEMNHGGAVMSGRGGKFKGIS